MAEATLSKVKIQPLGDHVLVKPVEAKETKRGGIIIPDSAKEKPQEGVIAACGKGKTTDDGKVIALDVKVGDKIQVEIAEVGDRGKLSLIPVSDKSEETQESAPESTDA